jgi:hypothetical protein
MSWSKVRRANWTEWYWPPVHNSDTARAAALTSSYFVLLIGAMTAATALRTNAQVAIPLADAIIYGGLALLMRRMSRVAAVLALALFLLGHGYEIYTSGVTLGIFVSVFIAGGIASGVRGTIAFHRYKRQLVSAQIYSNEDRSRQSDKALF